MPENITIAAVAGSLRAESWNRQILAVGVEALKGAGATVDVIDLKPLGLPLYDGDLEDASGLPPGALELKRRLGAAQGWLIASPEYNASIPGVFKNAIDWASRGDEDVFEGKIAGLMAASTGRLGGYRMMPHLRQTLTVLGVWLLPDQVNVAQVQTAFGPDGTLANEFYAKKIKKLAELLVSETKRRLLLRAA